MIIGAREDATQLLSRILVPPGEDIFFERLRVQRWAEHLAAELKWLDRAIASLTDDHDISGPRTHSAGLARAHPYEHPDSSEAADGKNGRGPREAASAPRAAPEEVGEDTAGE
jgi:hypothetical protein